MHNDQEIQKDVMNQMKWEPFLNASEIGVAVKNGIVTLSGQVDSYGKQIAAENAAKKVAGVKAIAQDIHVRFSSLLNKTDQEIAAAVLNALKWHSAVPDDKIKVKVENGNVRLEGEVEWDYQRVAAKKAVENLIGVRSVFNLIALKPKASPFEIKQKIASSFTRSATVDSAKISVDVNGSIVTLKGTVRSLVEKEDAEDAAWAAPGVTSVDNRIEIAISAYAYED